MNTKRSACSSALSDATSSVTLSELYLARQTPPSTEKSWLAKWDQATARSTLAHLSPRRRRERFFKQSMPNLCQVPVQKQTRNSSITLLSDKLSTPRARALILVPCAARFCRAGLPRRRFRLGRRVSFIRFSAVAGFFLASLQFRP